MSFHPKYSVQSGNLRIQAAQDDMRQRMRRLGVGELGDLSDLHFDLDDTFLNHLFLRGRILRGVAELGFLNVETHFWFSRSIAVYGGIALCDGTFIELVISKQRRDVLQAVVAGGRDRFELVGLKAGYKIGLETEFCWNHGSLPQAFQTPWLGATDWELPESVRFLMGRAPLEEHEVLPFVFLRSWAWYLSECRRLEQDF